MKKFVAVAAILAALSVIPANPAHAQGRRGMFQGLSLVQMPAPLQAQMKLTDDQKTKIKAIADQLMQDQQAAFQDIQNGGDRQAAIQKITANRQKADADAVALLTADQKAQYEGMKKESMQYEGLGPASVGLLGVEGLTDDQKGKLKALAADTATKRQQIFQSAAGDRQAAAQQAQALQTDTQAAIAKILTPDQVKQLEAATPRGGRRRQNQ